MNIAELNDMWVTFNVREDLLKDLTMGAEFEAIVPALDNKRVPWINRQPGLAS